MLLRPPIACGPYAQRTQLLSAAGVRYSTNRPYEEGRIKVERNEGMLFINSERLLPFDVSNPINWL